jgi:hypothetical protein
LKARGGGEEEEEVAEEVAEELVWDDGGDQEEAMLFRRMEAEWTHHVQCCCANARIGCTLRSLTLRGGESLETGILLRVLEFALDRPSGGGGRQTEGKGEGKGAASRGGMCFTEQYLLSCISTTSAPARVGWGGEHNVGRCSGWEGRLSLMSYAMAHSLSRQVWLGRDTVEQLLAVTEMRGENGCKWLHGYCDFLRHWYHY